VLPTTFELVESVDDRVTNALWAALLSQPLSSGPALGQTTNLQRSPHRSRGGTVNAISPQQVLLAPHTDKVKLSRTTLLEQPRRCPSEPDDESESGQSKVASVRV